MNQVAGDEDEEDEPLPLALQDLLDKIWGHYRTTQGNRWSQYYNSTFVKANDALASIQPFIQNTEQLGNRKQISKYFFL